MKAERGEIQLETIISRINADELDLQPNFQRGEIWDKKRQQRLIDTILRHWYVPAVHLVRDGDHREIVLDGQQRLATIREFFADGLTVDGTIEPFDDDLQEMHGLKFSQLPPGTQRALKRFMLPVITLTDYNPGEPNELFFRLNQSYNLTPPEKRNALHGEARDQVKSLVLELEEIGLLRRERVGFNNGRLAYDDIVARACVALELGTLRRHINNSVVEDFYRSQTFSGLTLAGLREAASDLLMQIEAAGGRVKFNKGTLQTWLLYCFWAPRATGDLPPYLLAHFEDDRAHVKRGDTERYEDRDRRFLTMVNLYDDRASYRVTDVSSVLARDLSLHLFSVRFHGTPPVRGSFELIDRLEHDQRSDPSAMAFDFIDAVQWGDHLRELG